MSTEEEGTVEKQAVEEHVIRVIIDRVDSSPSGAEVGDYFDIRGSRLMLPPGKSFNLYAMNAVFPVVALRSGELPDDDWLSRKPWICSPDPFENIVMRLDRVPISAVDYLPENNQQAAADANRGDAS